MGKYASFHQRLSNSKTLAQSRMRKEGLDIIPILELCPARTLLLIAVKERVRRTGNKNWYHLKRNHLLLCCDRARVFSPSVDYTIFQANRGVQEDESGVAMEATVCPINRTPVSELGLPVRSRWDLVFQGQ